MNRRIIAIVALNAGSTAYYDEVSGMHLTLSNPTGYIYEDTNFVGIKRAVKNKTLRLINGSFSIETETKDGFVEEEVITKKSNESSVQESTTEETIKVTPKKNTKTKASSKKDKKEDKSETENPVEEQSEQ